MQHNPEGCDRGELANLAAEATPDIIPQVHFSRHQLENGLRVLLCPDNRVPMVHVTLHYRVGSSFEHPGQSGFAHLFEHLMFQGSDNVPANEHGRLVDSAGGRWNASTSKDRTNYYNTLPSHEWKLGLWLESDRMLSLQVTEENFENQRQTVIEEKKQSYDNRPYGMAFLRFDELAYENWAYGHPIIGSEEDLQIASLADALNFHETHYGPSTAVIVLSGDFQTQAALELISDYFGEAPAKSVPQPPDLSEPPQTSEKRETIVDQLGMLAALYLGYHMPELGSDAYNALSMLALILTQGESSCMYRDLVHETGLVTSIWAGPNQYKGPGLFTLWCQIQAGAECDRTLRRIEGHLARMASEGPSEDELQRARNQVLHRFVSSRKTISGIAETLARFELMHGDADLINYQAARYLAISSEEIRRAAHDTFQNSNRTVLTVYPKSGN